MSRLSLSAILIAAALATAGMAAPAAATPDAALNYSHACTIPSGQVEVHFVLVQSPDVDYTGSAVQFTYSLDGGPVLAGSAPFVKRTGGTVHFAAYVAGPATTVEVLAGSLTVDGTTWQLANPGPKTTYACQPLSVVVGSLSAACFGTAVTVTWETVDETNVNGFNVWRGETDQEPEAQINPALIPAGGPATYHFPDPYPVQPGATAWYWIEVVYPTGGVLHQPPTSATCSVPTAVSLASFAAGGAADRLAGEMQGKRGCYPIYSKGVMRACYCYTAIGRIKAGLAFCKK